MPKLIKFIPAYSINPEIPELGDLGAEGMLHKAKPLPLVLAIVIKQWT